MELSLFQFKRFFEDRGPGILCRRSCFMTLIYGVIVIFTVVSVGSVSGVRGITALICCVVSLLAVWTGWLCFFISSSGSLFFT